MKKIFLFLIIFIIGCNSYNDYKEENPESPSMQDVYKKTNEWLNNPETFIADIVPFAIQIDDTLILKNSEFYRYENKKCNAINEFNKRLYDFFKKDNLILLKQSKKYREYIIYSTFDNVMYSLILTTPLIIGTQTIGILDAYNLTAENVVLYNLVSSKFLKVLCFNEDAFFLKEGSLKRGFKHIFKHTPIYWIKKGLKVPEHKSLFLKSDEEYILKLLDKFQKSPNITKIKKLPSKTSTYTAYKTKLLCDANIYREYILVVDENTKEIVTFYPTTKVPIKYLNNKYTNYKKLKYGK